MASACRACAHCGVEFFPRSNTQRFCGDKCRTVEPATRDCLQCKRVLPCSQFYKQSSGKYGREAVCKECKGQRRRANPLSNRQSHIRKYYGLAWADYVSLYEKQQGLCRICDKPMLLYESEKLQVAHVDHDHETGAVRGLLCHFCNSGLGYFKDSRSLLQRAIDYLD